MHNNAITALDSVRVGGLVFNDCSFELKDSSSKRGIHNIGMAEGQTHHGQRQIVRLIDLKAIPYGHGRT